MASSCAPSRPHSWVACPSRANKMASAVPQEPAPMTVIGSARRVIQPLIHRGGRRSLLRLREQRVEIDQRQEEIGESTLDDEVGDHFARVRKQQARAEAADQALSILNRVAGDGKQLGLL